MNKVMLATGFALLLAACQTAQIPTVVTCGDVFTSATTEEQLLQRFGRDHVRQETVQIGEGETQLGTVIDGIEIVWKDVEKRRNPRFIRVQSTYNGIRIGTDLKTLESLNGAPFRLAGFGWDYAGTVLSWGKGRLAHVTGGACRLFVRLSPGLNLNAEQQGAVSRNAGDRDFSSSSRDMQTINPRVYEILLSFE